MRPPETDGTTEALSRRRAEAANIALSVQIGQPHRVSLVLLWSITALLMVLLVWSAVAEIEDLTRTDGRVIPSARVQLVQNLEGGIVKEIHVHQGQAIERDDLIVSLSPTQASGELESRKAQLLALSARVARLEAESSAAERPVFPVEVLREGREYAKTESAELASRRAKHLGELSVIESQLVQRRKEAEDTRVTLATTEGLLQSALEEQSILGKLVERGLEPKLELIRIEARVRELVGKRDSARLGIPRVDAAIEELKSRRIALQTQYRSEVAAELSKTTGELNAHRKFLPVLSDKLQRTELRAPMKGVVNRLFVSTVGGVVKPGDPLAEIVPVDDQLVIEARISPKDIGFVHVGQSARVKLTAYDYSIFGSMEGTITQVSPDAVQVNERDSFYFARVETKTTVLEVLGKKLPILPGMQAQADIITGRKTVLNYLAKPLLAMKENAFRER